MHNCGYLFLFSTWIQIETLGLENMFKLFSILEVELLSLLKKQDNVKIFEIKFGKMF